MIRLLAVVAPLALLSGVVRAECTVADVSVQLTRAKWVDACRRTPCPTFKGAAVITHRCPSPIGVQVRLVGYDRSGAPIAVSEQWPWSIDNRAAGAHPISLDQALQYDPEIERFGVDVLSVKRWPE